MTRPNPTQSCPATCWSDWITYNTRYHRGCSVWADLKERMLIPIYHEEADLPLPAKARTLSRMSAFRSPRPEADGTFPTQLSGSRRILRTASLGHEGLFQSRTLSVRIGSISDPHGL